MPPDTAPTRIDREFRRNDARIPGYRKREAELRQHLSAQAGPMTDAEIVAGLKRNYLDSVIAYKNACQKATDELSRLPEASQDELDAVWSQHNSAMIDSEKFNVYHAFYVRSIPREMCDRACKITPENQWIVDELATANALLDKLNLPFYRQLVGNYYTRRVQHAVAVRRGALSFPRRLLPRAQVIAEYNGWKEDQKAIQHCQSRLRAKVGNVRLLDLWPGDPQHVSVIPEEQELDDVMTRAYLEAVLRVDPAEAVWEDPNDFDLEDADDGVDVNWTSLDFADLREQLELPIRISVNVTHLSGVKDLDFRQTQHLDNRCSICTQEYTEPTDLARCHHMFCFECIVPWVSGYKECPMCRKVADLHDLTIYQITRVEAGKGETGSVAKPILSTNQVDESKIQSRDDCKEHDAKGLTSPISTSVNAIAMPYLRSPGVGWPATPLPAVPPSRSADALDNIDREAQEEDVAEVTKLMGELSIAEENCSDEAQESHGEWDHVGDVEDSDGSEREDVEEDVRHS